MKHFKRLTLGHPVIMGRRTFDTLAAPLPSRRNVVITRDPHHAREGVEVAHSLTEALQLVAGEPEVFVVGGGEIYAEALPIADRLYLTVVHTEAEGDVLFPEIDSAEWVLREDERHEADEEHAHAFSFRLYLRAGESPAAN